jgi:hypothetical protein
MEGNCWRCGLWRLRTLTEGIGFLCHQCADKYAEQRCGLRSTQAHALDNADYGGEDFSGDAAAPLVSGTNCSPRQKTQSPNVGFHTGGSGEHARKTDVAGDRRDHSGPWFSR